MNRAQKMAWFAIITISIATILSVMAFGLLTYFYGFKKGMAGFAFLGLVGIVGLAQLIFKKDKGVQSDEREILIQKKAAFSGFAMCYGYLFLVCMVPWFILGPKATISINTLPQILIGGMIVVVFFQSLATIIGYGREAKENE